MKRAVTVPPAVRSAFVVGLQRESRHAVGLPDPLPMGRLLRVVDRASNCTDELTVLAGENENGYFLDYFTVANDGQTNWHGRVLQDGTGEALENYEGQWGRPFFPGDPAKTEAELQRIIAHNARVEGVLRAKGFK